MPKTKKERSLRKIRKLEEKLSKYRDALAMTSPDPEICSEPEVALVDPEVASINERSVEQESEAPGSLVKEQENDLQEDTRDDDEEHMEEEGPKEQEVEELSQDILTALGDGGPDKDAYGAEIKPEIYKIMANILTEGLEKGVHENLMREIKIPINAKLLQAPKLNSEFAGLLTNAHRDNLLKDRQQDLGCGMALVSQALNNILNNKFNKLEVIKKLSDSLRVLSNLHHQYTQVRRKMIAPYLDKGLTQNLNENKRSEFLYSQLEESVKTSSAMKRTINILKPKNVPKNYQNARRQNQPAKTTNSSNYKPGSYQANPGQAYRPQQRNHPRPLQQPRPAPRRPTSSYRGGRAKYP